MTCTPSSIVAERSPRQPRKVASPILFTLPGIVTDVSPLPAKAQIPISVRLAGKAMEVRAVQP